jgi:hypothetical protein
MNFHCEIQRFERMWTQESLEEYCKAGLISDVLYRVSQFACSTILGRKHLTQSGKHLILGIFIKNS